MSELTDFLVWLWRKHKRGEVPITTVQVVGTEVCYYIQEEERQLAEEGDKAT